MKVITALILLLAAFSAWAGKVQSVELSIPGMDCPVCPITIKKSLQKVEGVKRVEISYENKTASVSYDSTLTDINRLLKATEDVGYPSKVLKERE